MSIWTWSYGNFFSLFVSLLSRLQMILNHFSDGKFIIWRTMEYKIRQIYPRTRWNSFIIFKKKIYPLTESEKQVGWVIITNNTRQIHMMTIVISILSPSKFIFKFLSWLTQKLLFFYFFSAAQDWTVVFCLMESGKKCEKLMTTYIRKWLYKNLTKHLEWW